MFGRLPRIPCRFAPTIRRGSNNGQLVNGTSFSTRCFNMDRGAVINVPTRSLVPGLLPLSVPAVGLVSDVLTRRK